MKCPKCQRNHPRGREGMTCICGYGFVLDPKTDGYTDGKFLAAIRRASANGTYFYTENQLYAAACRGFKPQIGAVLMLIFVIAGAVMIYFGLSNNENPNYPSIILTIFGLVFLSVGIFSIRSALLPRIRRKEWDKWVAKWKASNQEMKGLITKRELETPPPDFKETDLYDYGVEQIVICERDELVDWLILNRFHFHNRAAVISESGYPSYLLPKINKLLTGNNSPTVYLLHDASDHGQKMATRIHTSAVFDLRNAKVIDMGISPEILPRIRSLKVVRRTTDDRHVTADMLPITLIQSLSLASFGHGLSYQMIYESEIAIEYDSDDGDGE